ncbi:protein containing DUF939, bacterial, partial [human gut metagenome]
MNNHLITEDDYYYEYMQMRARQCVILKRIYADIIRLTTTPEQGKALADFIRQTADEFEEQNNVETLLSELERLHTSRKLLLDLGNNAGTNSVAAFADSETHAFFHGNRGDQLNVHINVVAGHAHLSAFGQGDDAGNVGGTEVELRTIVVEERGMTAAFFLLQDVNMAIESGVGMNRAGNSQNLATLDLVTV